MVWAHDVKKGPWCGEVIDDKYPNKSMNNFLHLRWCAKRPPNSLKAKVKRLKKAKTPKITIFLKNYILNGFNLNLKLKIII